MDVMGWSSSVMVKRYAHVAARLRREIADWLNPFFWSANETKKMRLNAPQSFRDKRMIRHPAW
jgi:hypothetical protein